MAFPNIFGKKEKPKYFLALLLQEEKATAVIFEELKGKVSIISKKQEEFSKSIEEVEPEEFIDVLDTIISNAETSLPVEIETHQTVFGIKENWVEESTIKKNYLSRLKKACDSLGLAPIGFLVTSEAIAHLLQKEEGAPVSAILIEVGKKEIVVSLIRAGKILETHTAKHEENIPRVVDGLLKKIESMEILPSRILLFDGNTEELMQEFIGHQWSKSLPFLHVPKASLLSPDFATRAIIEASAKQMGFDVLQEEEKPDSSVQEQTLETEEVEDIQSEDNIKEKSDSEIFQEIPHEEFGFVFNKDITLVSQDVEENKKEELITLREENSTSPKQNSTPTSLNFLFVTFMSSIQTMGVLLKRMFPLSGIKKLFEKNPMFALTIPLVFGAVLIVFLLYLFGIKAIVTLQLQPKVVEETHDVTFSSSSKSDFSSHTIHTDFIAAQKEGSAETEATGKKEVGEKAKGQVTLYSRFAETKTFPAGTIITSSNNLDFTLDSSITISSASADASAAPSTAKSSVTAKQIGKESNLPSGAKFTVGALSSTLLIAKNDNAFSGGSKKEVTVVSKEDIERVTNEIYQQLEAGAREETKKQLASDMQLVSHLVNPTLVKSDFSKKVGEEAKSVTLKGNVEYTGIAYKREDIKEYAKFLLKDKFSSNLTVQEDGISADVQDIKKKIDADIQTSLKIKAMLLPKLDIHQIAENIAGKSFLHAEDFLLKIPQVTDSRIMLSPSLPFLPQILPRVSQNISVETVIHE